MDMHQDLPYTYPSQPVEYIPHRLQSDGWSCWIVTNRHLPLHCSSSQLQSIDSRNVVVVRNYLSQVLCDLWSSYTFRFCNSFSWAVYMVPLLLSWTLRHLWSYWPAHSVLSATTSPSLGAIRDQLLSNLSSWMWHCYFKVSTTSPRKCFAFNSVTFFYSCIISAGRFKVSVIGIGVECHPTWRMTSWLCTM